MDSPVADEDLLLTIQQLQKENARLRRRLAESEERLDTTTFVLDSIPDYAAYVDRNLLYQICNTTYLDDQHTARDEIIGSHAREVLGDSALGSIQVHIDRVLKGELVRFREWVETARFGRIYVEALYVPDMSSDGSVRGFAVLVRDITRLKELEDELARSRGDTT